MCEYQNELLSRQWFFSWGWNTHAIIQSQAYSVRPFTLVFLKNSFGVVPLCWVSLKWFPSFSIYSYSFLQFQRFYLFIFASYDAIFLTQVYSHFPIFGPGEKCQITTTPLNEKKSIPLNQVCVQMCHDPPERPNLHGEHMLMLEGRLQRRNNTGHQLPTHRALLPCARHHSTCFYTSDLFKLPSSPFCRNGTWAWWG